MRLWALAITCGLPHELIWQLSIPEIEAVVQCRVEERKAATLRAGLVAATIINVNRRPGQPIVQPNDFLPEEDEYLTPQQARAYFDSWAAGLNAGLGTPQ